MKLRIVGSLLLALIVPYLVGSFVFWDWHEVFASVISRSAYLFGFVCVAIASLTCSFWPHRRQY